MKNAERTPPLNFVLVVCDPLLLSSWHVQEVLASSVSTTLPAVGEAECVLLSLSLSALLFLLAHSIEAFRYVWLMHHRTRTGTDGRRAHSWGLTA